MGVGDAVGKAIIPAVDRLVELRYDSAMESVERLRERHSDASPPLLASVLVTRYRKELTAVGAAAGGAAALPGLGTGASLAASGADVTWTVSRLGELIMSIGGAYGHSAVEIEERRAWVLAVLGLASGAASGLSGVAGQIGQKGGVKIVKAIPMSQIVKINRALGGRIIVKWGTKQGAVRLGRLIPFGVGAGIGAAGNLLLVNSVGRSAEHFFDDRLVIA
jgi:hypothetical protein